MAQETAPCQHTQDVLVAGSEIIGLKEFFQGRLMFILLHQALGNPQQQFFIFWLQGFCLFVVNQRFAIVAKAFCTITQLHLGPKMIRRQDIRFYIKIHCQRILVHLLITAPQFSIGCHVALTQTKKNGRPRIIPDFKGKIRQHVQILVFRKDSVPHIPFRNE